MAELPKPKQNTQYTVSEGLKIQHYTNGSWAYWNGYYWQNIPREMGQNLYKLKFEKDFILADEDRLEIIKKGIQI